MIKLQVMTIFLKYKNVKSLVLLLAEKLNLKLKS